MVYVEMAGRCGNQLFHYAVARYIQIKANDNDLCLNCNSIFEKHRENEGFYDVLADFNTVPYEYYQKKGTVLVNETNILTKCIIGLKSIHIKLYAGKSRQERANKASFLVKVLNFFGIYWIREGVKEINVYKRKKSIVTGVCETGFIYEIIEQLREELQPKEEILPENREIMELISKNESVCISVRRGDFFNDKNAKSFAVCTTEYYLKAKEIMDSKLENAKYFVFSDDIIWCMNNLGLRNENVVYVSQEMPIYETLRLMYSCKHFILSNSTFSWWGQFLSRNINKIVISPQRWNNDGYDSVLIGKEWIKIDTK